MRHSFNLHFFPSPSSFNLNDFTNFVVFNITLWIILALIIRNCFRLIEFLYCFEILFFYIFFFLRSITFAFIKYFLVNWNILCCTLVQILFFNFFIRRLIWKSWIRLRLAWIILSWLIFRYFRLRLWDFSLIWNHELRIGRWFSGINHWRCCSWSNLFIFQMLFP